MASSSNAPSPSPAYIAREAEEILEPKNLPDLHVLIEKLYYSKGTENTSNLIFDCFIRQFPDLIVERLLRIYKNVFVRQKIRSFILSLLDSVLIKLEDSRVRLKTECLSIQRHLHSCFSHQETSDDDFKLFSSVISRVYVALSIQKIHSWPELSDYIILINYMKHKRALLIYSELTTVLDEDFLMELLKTDLYPMIVKGLFLNHQDLDEEEWCLDLEAGFNMALHFVNSKRNGLVCNLFHAIVSSVWELVNVKRREFLVRKGITRLVERVSRVASKFREPEYEFVKDLALTIMSTNGVGEVTQMAAKMIIEALDKYFKKRELDWFHD